MLWGSAGQGFGADGFANLLHSAASLTVIFTCTVLMYRKIETFAFPDTQLVTINRVLHHCKKKNMQKNARCTSQKTFASVTMIAVKLMSSLNISTNSDQTIIKETIFDSTLRILSK
jgi:uncharacterized membrane protein YhiD involved in acid resistance